MHASAPLPTGCIDIALKKVLGHRAKGLADKQAKLAAMAELTAGHSSLLAGGAAMRLPYAVFLLSFSLSFAVFLSSIDATAEICAAGEGRQLRCVLVCTHSTFTKTAGTFSVARLKMDLPFRNRLAFTGDVPALFAAIGVPRGGSNTARKGGLSCSKTLPFNQPGDRTENTAFQPGDRTEMAELTAPRRAGSGDR